MALPLSGPLAMSMVADFLQKPLRSVSINNNDIRALANRNETRTKISFSDLYGADKYYEYVITNPEPFSWQTSGHGYVHESVNAEDSNANTFPTDFTTQGEISTTAYKDFEILCVGFYPNPLDSRVGILIIFSGAISPLTMSKCEVRKLDDTLVASFTWPGVADALLFYPSAKYPWTAYPNYEWPARTQALNLASRQVSITECVALATAGYKIRLYWP